MKSTSENQDESARPGLKRPRSGDRIRSARDYFHKQLVRLRGTPEQIAGGGAIGLFVAMTPTIGIQTYIAVPVAALFKVNIIAAAITVWVTNPVTAPFIYGFNYLLGAKLLGYPLKAPFFSNPSWETLWHSGKGVFLAMSVGGILTGSVAAVAGYFFVLSLVKVAREKASRRRHKRKR